MTEKDWKKELLKFYGAMFECGDFEKLEDFIEETLQFQRQQDIKEFREMIEVIKNSNWIKNGLAIGERDAEAVDKTLDNLLTKLEEWNI